MSWTAGFITRLRAARSPRPKNREKKESRVIDVAASQCSRAELNQAPVPDLLVKTAHRLTAAGRLRCQGLRRHLQQDICRGDVFQHLKLN